MVPRAIAQDADRCDARRLDSVRPEGARGVLTLLQGEIRTRAPDWLLDAAFGTMIPGWGWRSTEATATMAV
jgi:hypothetical protein